MCGLLFELNRLVPNGMPGGVRGGRKFPLLDYLYERAKIAPKSLLSQAKVRRTRLREVALSHKRKGNRDLRQNI